MMRRRVANGLVRKASAAFASLIVALSVPAAVRKSNTLARFPADFDPAFMDWYAREVGKAEVEVVTAMVDVAGSANAKPYLGKIKAPVLALCPTGSNISTAEQEQALCDHIYSVRVVHLNSPYALLGMLEPAACAGQILNFAAMHDGIVCHE